MNKSSFRSIYIFHLSILRAHYDLTSPITLSYYITTTLLFKGLELTIFFVSNRSDGLKVLRR